MSDSTNIAFEASPKVISEICSAATVSGAQVSKPVVTSSPADALDSPIGGDEIRQILELVIVAFKAGAAGLVFFKSLQDILKKHPGERSGIPRPARAVVVGCRS
jgi:hypothetical protein